jgi:hypothetical protein
VIGGTRVGRAITANALDAVFLVGRYLARNSEPAIRGEVSDRHEEHLLFFRKRRQRQYLGQLAEVGRLSFFASARIMLPDAAPPCVRAHLAEGAAGETSSGDVDRIGVR